MCTTRKGSVSIRRVVTEINVNRPNTMKTDTCPGYFLRVSKLVKCSSRYMYSNRVHKCALDMRYNLVLGDYRRVRGFMNETDKIGSCPNESKHSGRNARSHNPSKGGRCLINCMGGSKIWMHNAVVAALAKRINGKGFVATPQESTIHQTIRK